MRTRALLRFHGVAMLSPMATRYLSELLTPDVLAAQDAAYGRHHSVPEGAPADELGPDEAAFVAQRDSFYLGTVSSSGWPYVQHSPSRASLRQLTPVAITNVLAAITSPPSR